MRGNKSNNNQTSHGQSNVKLQLNAKFKIRFLRTLATLNFTECKICVHDLSHIECIVRCSSVQYYFLNFIKLIKYFFFVCSLSTITMANGRNINKNMISRWNHKTKRIIIGKPAKKSSKHGAKKCCVYAYIYCTRDYDVMVSECALGTNQTIKIFFMKTTRIQLLRNNVNETLKQNNNHRIDAVPICWCIFLFLLLFFIFFFH